MKQMYKHYLLEIGVEELPSRFVNVGLDQLESKARNLFDEMHVKYENLQCFATPRRLVLWLDDVSVNEEVQIEKVKGPAEKIAYSEDGEPSKALLGFAKGHGVDLEDVFIEDVKGTPYIHVNIEKKNKSFEEVISENMAELIKSITFPKSMKWGGKNIRFARPIRWIVSMLDDRIVPFELEGIPVGNETRGLRFIGSQNIKLNHTEEYFDKLRENYVIVEGDKRREHILYHADLLAREVGGELEIDEDLLHEIVYIVEYPTPIRGEIDEEYLSLPAKVITTPMREHLRYIPVYDDKHRLLPYFITVRNGDEKGLETVIKGNEKVLTARLADAKFFYEEDLNTKLEDYVEELKDITFHEKLGTLYDKTMRLQMLSQDLGEWLLVGEETGQNIKRAAYLAKADLVTKMVTEFTELQGIMGRDYALASGENKIVAQAIEEQYMPRFATDDLPETTSGSVLSIADKLDTIVGLFCIDISPTGSQDPFAQRRAALGVINIIIDKNLELSLNQMIEQAMFAYFEVNGLVFDHHEVKSQVYDFFMGRLQNILENKGVRYDVIDAVLSTEEDRMLVLYNRAIELNEWITDEGRQLFLESFNRIGNLVKDHESVEYNTELFLPEEMAVHEAFVDIEEEVNHEFNSGNYIEGFDRLQILTQPITAYFEHIMVMDEDMEIRENRLSFLKAIHNLATRVVDLDKIVVK